MKKKLLALAIGISVIQISQAQISKGSLFLGGSVGFGNFNTENNQVGSTTPGQESKSSQWTVRPQIGKAIGENKILGVFLDFGGQKTENISGITNQKRNTSIYGGGIFYRQYYPIGKRFFLFGESALGFSVGKENRRVIQPSVDRLQGDSKTTIVRLALTPGISFAATRKLYLEATLNNLLDLAYQSQKGTEYNFQGNPAFNNSSDGLAVSANANGFSNLSVGLRWILPTRK